MNRVYGDVVERLGWTLLHSVWQELLVAALLALSLVALRRRTPQARHAAAVTALLLLVALPAVTFVTLPARTTATRSQPAVTALPARETPALEPAAQPIAREAAAPQQPAPAPSPPAPVGLNDRLHPLLPWLVAAWAVGVIVLSAWHVGGWVQVRRLQRVGTRPLDADWQARLASLCRALRVTRPVRLLESSLVQVPTVAGWLRPVILVPASALSGLSPHELEAILAHELAHVRRNDFVINVLQAAVETLLFYHPAAWWVSNQVRREREDCCDDEAARASGGAVAYARALASLDELRPPAPSPHWALAATGSPLVRRVRRLLGRSQPRAGTSGRAWPVAGAVLGVLVACAATRLRAGAADAGGAGPAVFTLRGTVTDAATGKRVGQFRVVRAPVNPATPAPWQSHTVQSFSDGRYELPLERAWPVTRLRVDAEGYRPAVSRAVEKQSGAVTLDFVLEPAEGVHGVVLAPGGKPAADAQVTWATVTAEVNVNDGRLSLGGHGRELGTVVTTDADGRFRLPPEVDAGTIVVAHDSGYAEVASGAFRSGEQIHLDAWSSVGGRLDVPGGPAPDWSVSISSARPNDPSPYVTHYATLPLDEKGTFEAARLAPGRHSLCVVVKDGTGYASVSGTYADVVLQPGKGADVTLGGRGRPVVGRVVAAGKAPGAVDWSKVKLRFMLEAPHIGFLVDDPMRKAYTAFLAGARAAAYIRDFTPAADGTFRLEHVPQGRYQLLGPVRLASRVVVDPMPNGTSDLPLDLGDVPLTGEPPMKEGAGGEVAGAQDTRQAADTATIDGRLLDVNGAPLFNWRVKLWAADEPDSRKPAAMTETARDGHFRFENTPTSKTWRLTVAELGNLDLDAGPPLGGFRLAPRQYQAVIEIDGNRRAALKLDPAARVEPAVPRRNNFAGRGPVELSIEDIARIDVGMASKVQRREALKAEIARLSVKLLPGHRSIVILKQELAAVEREIEEAAETFRTNWAANNLPPDDPAVLRLKAARERAEQVAQRYGPAHPAALGAREEVGAAEAEVTTRAARNLAERKAQETQRQAEAATYYLGGDVPRPGAYQLGARKVNLLQALIAAGFDVNRNADRRVQLLRRGAEGREAVTSLTVKDLLDRRDRDTFLQGDDVVIVKAPGGKAEAGDAVKGEN